MQRGERINVRIRVHMWECGIKSRSWVRVEHCIRCEYVETGESGGGWRESHQRRGNWPHWDSRCAWIQTSTPTSLGHSLKNGTKELVKESQPFKKPLTAVPNVGLNPEVGIGYGLSIPFGANMLELVRVLVVEVVCTRFRFLISWFHNSGGRALPFCLM